MRSLCRFAVLLCALAASSGASAAPAPTDIFQLINRGDATGVALALKRNPALIKTKNQYGRTPLTQAIVARQDEIAKFLVAKESPVTPFDAAALGETSTLREMVATNPGLLKMRYFGRTLLMWAALRHHKETVDMLVSLGAPLDIYAAAALGLTDKVKELVATDSRNLAGEGPEGVTPLEISVISGSLDTAKFLLENGADPESAEDRSLLFYAAARGDVPMIKLLLAHGARKEAFHPGWGTPYTYALSKHQKEAAQLLKP